MTDTLKEKYPIIIQSLGAGLLAVMTWIASQVWQNQAVMSSELAEIRITAVRTDAAIQRELSDMKVASAKTEANRFTSQDWMRISEELMTKFSMYSDRINGNERRIQVLESNIASIKEMLMGIDQKLVGSSKP